MRVYLARLTTSGRPEADHEEADLTGALGPLRRAVEQVLSGEIINATAAAGCWPPHAVVVDGKPTRPLDARGRTGSAFAARKGRP